MTKVLEEAAKRPGKERDSLGRALLDELPSERPWDEFLARSHDLLSEGGIG